MRVVLLTTDQASQRLLASRLAETHELVLVVVDELFTNSSGTRRLKALLRQPAAIPGRIRDRAIRWLLPRTEADFAAHFERLGATPLERLACRVVRAPNINVPEIAQKIEVARPDIIAVYGGRLLRPPVLSCRSQFGTINLHPGLSPYYRGVSCTFWTLYHEEPEYAGATIHYVSSGIDSGDIVLSARCELAENDSIAALDCKVVELGQSLLLRALGLLAEGRAPRVPQWEKGRLCLSRDYTPTARLALERKLRDGLVSRCLARLREHAPTIRTVDVA